VLYVVLGPPTAGKSTWVLQRATTYDIVIDYDRLAVALTGTGAHGHNHPSQLTAVVKKVRRAAIDAAVGYADQVDVYVIHSKPGIDAMRRYQGLGAQIVVVDPGRDVVMARCKAERPWQLQVAVAEWYDRGLGAMYQRYSTPRVDEVECATSRRW